jgi:hypothetical protein
VHHWIHNARRAVITSTFLNTASDADYLGRKVGYQQYSGRKSIEQPHFKHSAACKQNTLYAFSSALATQPRYAYMRRMHVCITCLTKLNIDEQGAISSPHGIENLSHAHIRTNQPLRSCANSAAFGDSACMHHSDVRNGRSMSNCFIESQSYLLLSALLVQGVRRKA